MKMTNYGGVDSFFDVEPHDSSPVLKGEYATVTSPVIQKTLNSPIHSPTNMSKSKGHRNYYSDSRSGSRSPQSRSRSPSPVNNAYSDSFDSEDSAQDSRPSSRPTKSKTVSRKNKATVNKRTSSSYSRDSRYSTASNVTSSGYGKTRKTYSTVKRKITKGGNKGRASSIPGNATPRNVTEVSKRMLSAKGHTISRLRSENEEIRLKYEESIREIKLLKQLQRKQERALDKFEGTESELPELLRNHSAELDSLHQRVRKYKDQDRTKDRQLKEQHQELCKLQSEMRKMKKVAGDKHLLERDSLQHKLEKLSEQHDEKDKRVADLERYIENIRKNQNHQLNDIKIREQELKGQNNSLEMENERLQVQLREKDKELDIRNIYSHRVIKPPMKLRSTKSPTYPLKFMLDKSTTTDNLIPSPHPPEAPKRTSSAEIRQQISEKKNNIVGKETKPVVVEKQTKELDEHEMILQQLDLGIKLKENNDDEDDVMKSLAMAKKRREEQHLKEEEQRRKEEQLRREREEEIRLKREEEEERLRIKKSREEEANKGYVPSFASSKKPSNIPRPLAINRNAQSKPTNVASQPATSNSQQAKSKPANVASQPPANDSQQAKSKPVNVASQPPTSNSQQANVLQAIPTGKPREPLPQTVKPSWFEGLTTTNTSNSNMEKQRLDKDTAKSFKPNPTPAKSSVLAPSDDDDDVPYFGSKPKTNQATYAVNSVRGLQEYSTERSGSAEKGSRGFGGGKVFGEEHNIKSSYNQTVTSTNGNHTSSNNKERKTEELERMNRDKEEARRKKEELLAKMREIDQKNEKPESGRSRKNYKFTDPVENLHNGRPSHGLGSMASLSKDDDELAFGSYAPTFSKGGGGSKKHQEKAFANGHANEKKSELLSNLFSKGDSEKSNGSSDNDEGFSFGTKAKPVKDKSAFPWDSGVDGGKETVGAKTGRRAGGMDNSLFVADTKSPYIGKLAVNEVDDFDDDLEEVIL